MLYPHRLQCYVITYLQHLIMKRFKILFKKKEDVNVTKPAELQQPTLEGNKGQGKSSMIILDQFTFQIMHKF